MTIERQQAAAIVKISRELEEIKDILKQAFPPADTRPLAERMKEATEAMVGSLTPESRAMVEAQLGGFND
jgi:hypothetical protein